MNERRWLKIRDFLTFRPKDILENKKYMFECKDSKSETGHSLLVRVNATHAGIVTGNRKFYRPDYMQDCVNTWVPSQTVACPVLRGHDEEGDVLGRVREAKYIDDSWKYKNDFPIIRDSLFYNRDSRARKIGLHKSVDWIVDNMVPLKDYRGLGHIELGLQLTNPDAIAKVLRDEYLSVSAGAITDSAICSICHTDWASDDKCEHKLGQKVEDGHRMFLISGRFKYQELSFINFPADPFAGVTSYELRDSLEKMFFLGLPLEAQNTMVERGLKLTDSLYESDIQISYEEQTMTIDQAAMEQSIKNPELTSVIAFELRDQLLAWSPETEDDKTAKRSLQSTLTAKIRKNGWKQEDAAEVTDAAVLAEMDAIAAVEDSDVVAAVVEADSSEAKTTAVDAVQDKSVIKDTTTATVQIDPEIQAIADSVKLTDAVESKEPDPRAKEVLGHYAALDAHHKAADDDLKYKMHDLHAAISERWSKDQWVEWAKKRLAEHCKDSVFVTKDELTLKDETVLELTDENKTLQDSLASKNKSIAAFFTDSKRSLATAVVMHHCLKGSDGFKDVSTEVIQDKIAEYAKRHVQSLKDSLADIFHDLKWVKPTEVPKPETKSKDSAITVNDNARVDESDSARTPEQIAATKVQDTAKLNRMLSYIHDESERLRLIADVKYGRVQLS